MGDCTSCSVKPTSAATSCAWARRWGLLPQAWEEHRDRGLAHAELGNNARAVVDLETYLVNAEESIDIDMLADKVEQLRRKVS